MASRIDITIDEILDSRYNIKKDGVKLGEFLFCNDEEYVCQYMENWIAQFDIFPEHLHTPEFYITRLFTYNEYIQHHKGHQQVLLTEVSKRKFGFLADFELSYQGYCQCISSIAEENNPQVALFFSKPLSVIVSRTDRLLHTYLVGGTGKGKTEVAKICIKDDIDREDCAVVVVDPKGDLAKQVASFKCFAPNAPHHDRLVYLNPVLFQDENFVFNFFDQFDDIDLAVQEATNILTAIFREMGNSSDFTGAMESMLSPLLALILQNKLNMYDLYRLVDTGYQEGRKKVEPDISDLLDGVQNLDNDMYKYFFNTKFPHAAITTKQGIEWRIARLLYNKLFLNHTSGKSTINLKELMDQKKVIVISVSKGEMGSTYAGILGKFLISAIQVIVQQRSAIPKEQRVPVMLYIDEFQNYVTDSTKTGLAEARSNGLAYFLIQQLTRQKMDSDYIRTLMGNTNVKIMAQSSYENIEDMSKQMDVPAKDLLALEKYSYYIKISNGKAVKFRPMDTSLIDYNYSMSKQEFDIVLQEQKEKYYRVPSPLIIDEEDVKDDIDFKDNIDDLPFPLD